MSLKPHTSADGRPRIWIASNRDHQTANWSRHPAGRPVFAATPGAALDAAIAELGDAPAVILWSGRGRHDFAPAEPP